MEFSSWLESILLLSNATASRKYTKTYYIVCRRRRSRDPREASGIHEILAENSARLLLLLPSKTYTTKALLFPWFFTGPSLGRYLGRSLLLFLAIVYMISTKNLYRKMRKEFFTLLVLDFQNHITKDPVLCERLCLTWNTYLLIWDIDQWRLQKENNHFQIQIFLYTRFYKPKKYALSNEKQSS